jgi:hypothetical protein
MINATVTATVIEVAMHPHTIQVMSVVLFVCSSSKMYSVIKSVNEIWLVLKQMYVVFLNK